MAISNKRIKQIRWINEHYLNTVSAVLTWINTTVMVLVGIAHVYIPVHTPFGLFAGIVLASSGAMSKHINDRFTQNNLNNKNDHLKKKIRKKIARDTTQSNWFIGLSIPCIILTSGSCFFYLYNSVPLLTSALELPLSNTVVNILAITSASALGLSTLIHSWFHTFDLWQHLREQPEVKTKATTREDSGTYQMVYKFLYVPLANLFQDETKNTSDKKEKHRTRKLSDGQPTLDESLASTMPRFSNSTVPSTVSPPPSFR